MNLLQPLLLAKQVPLAPRYHLRGSIISHRHKVLEQLEPLLALDARRRYVKIKTEIASYMFELAWGEDTNECGVHGGLPGGKHMHDKIAERLFVPAAH